MKNWINRFHARLDAWGEKLCEKEIRIPVDLTVGILFFLFALAILFVFYVSGIRADFAPGSEDESNLAHAVKNAWTLLGAITGLLSVFLVDRKTLRFETRAPLLGQILKFVLGLALVAGIKAALKPLFYAVLPSGPADCLRYYLVVLLAGIVWPRTFSFWAKIGEKKEA